MKEGWEIKKLGEVCTINPPKKEALSRLTSDDMVSFLPMEDLDIKAYYTEPKQHRLFSDVQSSYTYFTNGDVLLAKVTPCFENGKIGIAHNLINGIGFGSSEFLVFRLKEAILKEFLYYYLQNKTFVKEAIKNLTGSSGLRRVPKTFVENSKIPVPSIAEQEKIVAELDCLSGIIEKKKQQLKEYDALAQSIFYEMFGNPVDNDKGWETRILKDVSTLLNGRAYKQNELLSEGKYKVLRVGNFFTNGNYYYSDLELEEDKYCDNGDLLFAWSASFGAFIWNEGKVIYHYHIWKVLYDAKVLDIQYYRYLLNTMTNFFMKDVHGIGMVHLTKAGMEQYVLPLPPLALQQQFASKIEAIEKQKTLIKKSIEEVETLFNSRMDYYFN